MPLAPALTSASSCSAAARPKPGSTLATERHAREVDESILVRRRVRDSDPRFRSSPRSCGLLTTMRRTLRSSSAFTTLASASGEVSCGGCPWKSIAGNFAFGTGCCGTTSVDSRLVLADVGYRELRLATRARTGTGSALSALSLRPLRDGNGRRRDEDEHGDEVLCASCRAFYLSRGGKSVAVSR